MKRITRSLLSLCLAFVLCAALLPMNVAKATNEGPFMITGYDVSSSSVAMGDEVTVTLYLYRTDGRNDSISLIRSVDSFQGDSTYYPQAPSAGKDGTTYTVNLKHLTYTGDDARTLKFTIYYTNKDGEGAYQDGSVIIRECVPYTEPKPEPEPTPETIPAPRAVFNSDGMVSAIAAGETKVITVYIQNAGTTAMRDPILTLKSSGSLLIMGSQDYMLDDIRAGRDTAVNVTVKALDKVESQMQTIDASLSFYYDDGTQLTNGSASGSVNVLSAVSNDGQNEDIASPTPIVILSKYNYGGSSVAAGSGTNLSFSFTNTSKKLAIENVMVTVTGGSDLMLNGSTNTFYFDSVAAGGSKSVTVPMKAAQLISASAQNVQIAVTYEYVDQNARKSGSATLSLSVPLYQPDRFELSEPKTSYTGYVGEETSLTIDYVNKGKSAISNVDATISGDIDSPTPYQRVGTIDGGKNGTIAFAVTPQLEGENQVKIVITYEDSNGNTKERVFEATVEAMAYEPADPGMDDPGMIDPEPASTFPWKYVIIAVVAALIVLLIVLR
ncbi:MAG: COG1361 S-layer family protein, partial [Oscillospiraceae bacterium]